MQSTGLIAVLLLAYVGDSFACLSNPGQLPCDVNPCLNGATCTNVDVTSYVCSCTDSYEGNNCETLKASPCASSPCQNGGTCTVVADFYFCTCEAAKYSGYNCDLTVSPCTSGPCQNGGTCNQIGDTFDYTCDCPAGFFDDTCSSSFTSTKVETSTTSGATATTSGQTTTSGITATTSGQGSTPVTPTISTTTKTPECPNNQEYNFCASPCPQTCRNPEIGICIQMCQQRCDCPHEFPILDEETGFCVTLETCPVTSTTDEPEATTVEGSTDVEETTAEMPVTTVEGSTDDEETTAEMPVTTVEGSTAAVSSTTSGVSSSTAGVSSTTASSTIASSTTVSSTTASSTTVSSTTVSSTTVSICASNPCENGGVCSEGFFGITYRCACPDRYEGANCETFVAACKSSPCQNGGSCANIDGGLTYECTCPVVWTGTDCETLITPCEPSPCQNGGTCTDNGDATYTCACKEGYNGTDCENDFTCSGNLAECLPIMSDFSRNYAESVAYCEANGWHLAYVEDSAKYELMLNWVQTFWQTEFAGFDIDTRNHWLGMQYLGNRQAANLGGANTTPYTIVNWYPLGYPTSLESFPANDRMVMLASVSDSNSFFQGLRNIDPDSTYYAVCQNPAYISTL